MQFNIFFHSLPFCIRPLLPKYHWHDGIATWLSFLNLFFGKLEQRSESNRIESSYITVYLGNKSEFCSGAVEQRRKCLKIPVDSIKPFEDCISFPCGFVRFRVSHELGIFYNNEANAFTQWRTGQTRLWIVARCEEREVSISQGVEDFFLERQFRNWTAPKCLNTAYTTCT